MTDESTPGTPHYFVFEIATDREVRQIRETAISEKEARRKLHFFHPGTRGRTVKLLAHFPQFRMDEPPLEFYLRIMKDAAIE